MFPLGIWVLVPSVKKDFIEAGSIYARRALRMLDISPYLSAMFKRGLRKGEARETAELILEEGMMFTSMVGVELTNEMVDINQRMDDFKAEVETRFEAGDRVEQSLRERLEGERSRGLGSLIGWRSWRRRVRGLNRSWRCCRTRGGSRRRG